MSAELLTVLNRPPQSPRHQPLTTIHPGQQPLTPDGTLPLSPHHSSYSPQRSSPGGEGGGAGGDGGGGALLQLLAGGPSPLPSPRCSSLTHSLRFISDPDTAPSPPCSQQYILWVSPVCLPVCLLTGLSTLFQEALQNMERVKDESQIDVMSSQSATSKLILTIKKQGPTTSHYYFDTHSLKSSH